MQRRSNMHSTTLLILLSMITIVLQFSIYYFSATTYIILGVSGLILFLCCHILLEYSASYEVCFHYSLLNLFISSIIILLSYLGNGQSFLPYSGAMSGIAVLNWLIPSLHCFLRYMLDYGTKVDDYLSFYRYHSILFGICYLGTIFFAAFSSFFSWAYPYPAPEVNFIPFNIISALIEDYLYGMISLPEIIRYLTFRILPLLPYGFYIILIFRRTNRLWRLAALLFLPLLIEVLQLFIIPSRCDVDDVLYGLIGGLLGSLFFYLVNILFRSFTGKDFPEKDTVSIYNNNLHF